MHHIYAATDQSCLFIGAASPLSECPVAPKLAMTEHVCERPFCPKLSLPRLA